LIHFEKAIKMFVFPTNHETRMHQKS